MIHTIILLSLLGLTHCVSLFSMTELKYSLKKTVLIYCGYFAAFVATFVVLYYSGGLNYTYSLGYIITIIISFFFFLFASSDPMCKKVFLFVSYANVFSILGSISAAICNIILAGEPIRTIHYVRGIARTVLLIPIIWFYIRRLRPTVRSVSSNRRKTWYSISVVSFLFLIVFALFMMLFLDNRIHTKSYFAFFTMAVIIYCSTLWIVFGTIRSMIDESNAELTRQNVMYLQGQLEAAKKNEIYAKTIRHDFRHHSQNVAAMLQSGKPEDALMYIEKYDESLHAAKHNDFCPNVTVNAILNSFYTKAQNEGISIDICADTQSEIKIADMDMVAILSNLLENALNGCREIGAAGKITVNIRTVSDKTVIVCSNPCKPEIEIENNMLKHRGIGITSMQLAANKYNGDISYHRENGILTVCVILKTLDVRH